ncbi:MAG: GDP-mannose 4,6-dehydratase, partial [Candidatus Paceibacterota bacterium]
YQPRTPYNASKASGDLIAKAYYHTFGLPVTISYCANNYGTHQFPEKVIPVFAIKALKNESLPVFKSSDNKREWIHVLDHCQAIDLILNKGKVGETYNIGTGLEKTVANIADGILDILDKPKNLKQIVPDRPGHDSRYLLDSSKMRRLGWTPKTKWTDGLIETVDWYKNNPRWWRPLLVKSHSWKKR